MFFLIPIGHAEDAVRRLPWVTIALALACIAAHFLGGRQAAEKLADQRAAEVVEYFVEHDYLELHQDLVDDARWLELQKSGFKIDFDGERKVPPPPLAQQQREQKQLDRLTAAWLEAKNENPNFRWGLVPAHFDAPDLVAYMFLHAGLMHLIGNLIFLWLVGPPLEDVWGRPFFAAFYLAAGILGGLMWVARYPESTVPLIGASGAVAGLMGAFMVRYGKTEVRLFYFIFWLLPFFLRTGIFNAPAWLMLSLWFGRELFSATLLENFGGVAFWVHVWGFAFGGGIAWLVRYLKLEERFFQPKIDTKLGEGDLNPVVEQAYELRQQGRPEQAWDLLAAETWKNRGNYEANLALWDVAGPLGRHAQATGCFLRCIHWELSQGEVQLALFHWLELVEQVPGVQIDLDLRIRLAEAMVADQRDGEAAELLAGVHEGLDPAVPLGMKVRLARAAVGARSASAPPLIEALLANPGLPEAVRSELTELLARTRAFAPSAPATGSPAAGSPAGVVAETPVHRTLKVMAAVPQRLVGDRLTVDLQGQGPRTLPLDRVQAIAAARIADGSGTSYVVIDLLVDPLWDERPRVRTVRLRSSDFAAGHLIPTEHDPEKALAALLENLLVASGANAVPDAESARGRPFYRFVSVAEYESKVLGLSSQG